MLYLGSAVVEALLPIRPEEAVIDPATSVFRLSASQISRRTKAVAKKAGEGVAQPPRVWIAQDLSAARAVLPELMTAGRWDSTTMPARHTEAKPRSDGPWHDITAATSGDEYAAAFSDV